MKKFLGIAARAPARRSVAQEDCLHREGAFAWNCAGPVEGMRCTQIVEPADPDTREDNFLCW